MKYWWVNQNKTGKQEVEGGYMWSPKLNSVGRQEYHWENMTKVKKGDIVFSYYDKKIQCIGMIRGKAYDCLRPGNFGETGEAWDRDGWKVDVIYKELSSPLDHRDFWKKLQPLLPEKYSPINYNTHPREGYLFEVPDAMAALIFGNLIIDQLS